MCVCVCILIDRYLTYLVILKNCDTTKQSLCVFQYIYIYIYIYISSSSSCRAGSTDIPDPLSPLLPIVHRPRQVFRTTSRIFT